MCSIAVATIAAAPSALNPVIHSIRQPSQNQLWEKFMFDVTRYRLKQVAKRLLQWRRFSGELADLEQKVVCGHIRRLEERIAQLEGRKAEPYGPWQDTDPLPSLKLPISQAATSEQFSEPVYAAWCDRLNDVPRYHRKQWEFIYILQCLEQHGLLHGGTRGVGFGVGQEPIPDYLASRDVEVLATDLDVQEAADKGWVETDQHASREDDLQFRYIASRGQFKRNVRFRAADMNNVPDELTGYQFTWSACALEHLGSIDKGLAFIRRSLECLEPGGLAVHTTELNVSSDDETLESGGTVLFRRSDLQQLADNLRSEGHEIELNFNLGNQPLDQYHDVAPYSENIHLKIQLDQYVTTSFGLCIRKAA
jgi:hypothetical protein